MNISEILNIAIPALLTTVIIPFLATAITALTSYIKTKTNNAKLDKYFEMANDAVVTAVSEVMQTFVSEMKKAGTWDKDTAVKALEMAKLKAQEIMGVEALKALPEIVGDVEAWLNSKIEAATLAAKCTLPAVTPAPAATGATA
ncbi:hypothetical protein SAMN02745823_02547 [Sporobacter termitidis DSM 10068]|uniref:Bacteriophage holin of superfamily 6 (Holin_LLH) n=1 Tax=Sporobacter termitidis DSM 10068 TaxID=1123282 RepID=A0A1M5YHU5_9FIRM|nr:hypothetical protein [Sporobacter termitidis]SHI11504.1 hypothetical protein SAMN02745823_02547 [Sporobacter termitidis DSM 10068]